MNNDLTYAYHGNKYFIINNNLVKAIYFTENKMTSITAKENKIFIISNDNLRSVISDGNKITMCKNKNKIVAELKDDGFYINDEKVNYNNDDLVLFSNDDSCIEQRIEEAE